MLEQITGGRTHTAMFAFLCPSQQCKDSGSYPYLEEGFATGHLECPRCRTQYHATFVGPDAQGSTTVRCLAQLKEER